MCMDVRSLFHICTWTIAIRAEFQIRVNTKEISAYVCPSTPKPGILFIPTTAVCTFEWKSRICVTDKFLRSENHGSRSDWEDVRVASFVEFRHLQAGSVRIVTSMRVAPGLSNDSLLFSTGLAVISSIEW